MSATASKCFNQTITLDSSSDGDIIDCSTEDINENYKFCKTPRSQLGCNHTSATKNEVILLKSFQFKIDNQQVKSSTSDRFENSVKCKTRSGSKKNDSLASIISASTPTGDKNGDLLLPIMNTLQASSKKTPESYYLSKSKLQRIEKWLVENDVERISTPPFSNLSGTPRSLRRKSSTPKTQTPCGSKKITPKCNRDGSIGASSVDSEVEKVLVAVYGDDWKNKNVIKKSKTEPRKTKTKNIIPSTKTDIKTNVEKEMNNKPMKSVRRNIMKYDLLRRGLVTDEKSDYLDNTFSLGVEKLNESGSNYDLVTEKNFSTRKTIRKNSDSSSSDSWRPQSVKKKKREATKKTFSTKENRTPASKKNVSPEKTPVKTFLASLSVSTPKRRCHPEAQDFKVNFKTKKEELAQKLFKLYNSEVFGNGLPEDMNISWNIKLRGTAGYCYNKKILKSTGQVIRLSRIEFSTKIIDRADRLRDTMIHELCHAASWVIDGMLDGHGSVWMKWAQKAMERFPELPAIKRCHNYEIAAKYTYRCTGCGYSINRHSKSIDTERKRCGYCFGVFEIYVNKKKRGKGEVPEFNSTRTLRAPNNFALFVKENYHNVRSAKKDAKHKEIMKILGQKYAETKGKTESDKA